MLARSRNCWCNTVKKEQAVLLPTKSWTQNQVICNWFSTRTIIQSDLSAVRHGSAHQSEKAIWPPTTNASIHTLSKIPTLLASSHICSFTHSLLVGSCMWTPGACSQCEGVTRWVGWLGDDVWQLKFQILQMADIMTHISCNDWLSGKAGRMWSGRQEWSGGLSPRNC